MKTFVLVFTIMLLSCACNPRIADGVRKKDLKKDIEMVTDKGLVVLRLSDETPQHRNNFIRLVKSAFYDSILFHRVINGFVVQTGDPRTRPSYRQTNAASYTIPAEFVPELFHKRGALNAARTSEETNPLQASSGTQFTMIQGKVFTDSMIDASEQRVTRMNATRMVYQDPANKALLDKLREYTTAKDTAAARTIRNQIDTLTSRKTKEIPAFRFPAAHRQIYQTIGGAPHLDGNYTVFGKVVKGMEVVDSIAAMKTSRDRPVEDVRILKARLIKREADSKESF